MAILKNQETGKTVIFEHNGVKINIPEKVMESWVKKVKEDGIVSYIFHRDYVRKYIENNAPNAAALKPDKFKSFIFALDTYIADKAGIKVNPDFPVTIRNTLNIKKDAVVFTLEGHENVEIPLDLYYKWISSILSNGGVDKETSIEILRYVQTGKGKEASLSDIGFYTEFAKNLFSGPEPQFNEYSERFASALGNRLMEQAKKIAILPISTSKKAGVLTGMSESKAFITVYSEGKEHKLDLDIKIYHEIYYATVDNNGKVPNWARTKLHSHLTKPTIGKYFSPDMKATYQKQALDDTALLASFFESKVAADASSAKCKLIPCK